MKTSSYTLRLHLIILGLHLPFPTEYTHLGKIPLYIGEILLGC